MFIQLWLQDTEFKDTKHHNKLYLHEKKRPLTLFIMLIQSKY